MPRAIVDFLVILIQVYYWLIIVRVILSWIPLPDNDLVRSVYGLIHRVTEPYLSLFRRLIPGMGRGGIGIDFSPIIAIFVLYIIANFVRGL